MKTQNILLAVFWSVIAIALLIVAVFETDAIEVGGMADGSPTEFVLITLMELLTLACIPTALRLFKLGSVSTRLRDNYLRWAVVRIAMLGLPLVVNTLLYYIYMATAFGYMAIILLISMVFVYPSAARREAETATREEGEEI